MRLRARWRLRRRRRVGAAVASGVSAALRSARRRLMDSFMRKQAATAAPWWNGPRKGPLRVPAWSGRAVEHGHDVQSGHRGEHGGAHGDEAEALLHPEGPDTAAVPWALVDGDGAHSTRHRTTTTPRVGHASHAIGPHPSGPGARARPAPSALSQHTSTGDAM